MREEDMLTQVDLPVLRQGAIGPSVAILQRLLVVYGYQNYLGRHPVDGVFGLRTSAAVKAFQADHALIKDGIVGLLTWKAMAHPFDRRLI